ncbi:MAG: SDR family oxidoreductase [Polyangiaceae bacterium]|nr:SDR family oxidoreductase [Polyangiaceae bacterium]
MSVPGKLPIHPNELAGKRALVTGGTEGVGAAIVSRLTAAGARVATAARIERPSRDGSDLHIQADISTASGVDAVVRTLVDRYGGVDVVVHNAGGSSAPEGGFAALTDETWQRELDLNLLSAVRLDRALVPSMLAQRWGVIVHVTSIQRVLPLYHATLGYAAAKAALATYSEGLAKEVGPKGVRVISVAPGFTETSAARRHILRVAEARGVDEATARQGLVNSLGGTPIGRPNTPEEVAELIAFLVSARPATIQGVEYIIDGGNVPTV